MPPLAPKNTCNLGHLFWVPPVRANVDNIQKLNTMLTFIYIVCTLSCILQTRVWCMSLMSHTEFCGPYKTWNAVTVNISHQRFIWCESENKWQKGYSVKGRLQYLLLELTLKWQLQDLQITITRLQDLQFDNNRTTKAMWSMFLKNNTKIQYLATLDTAYCPVGSFSIYNVTLFQFYLKLSTQHHTWYMQWVSQGQCYIQHMEHHSYNHHHQIHGYSQDAYTADLGQGVTP